MKRFLTLFAILLIMAVTAYANGDGPYLGPLRISLVTTPGITAAPIIDVLNSSGGDYTPAQRVTLTSQKTDDGGILSFVLDGTTPVPGGTFWTDLLYHKDDLVRVTFNGVVLSIERMEVMYAKQGLYGARIEPSEITAGSAGQVITSNGTTNTWTAPANDWHLGGNADTSPGTNYIGTSDGQALIFKVNGQNSGTIDFNTLHTTSFGFQALAVVTGGTGSQGTENTAVGYKALIANTTGQYNTAVGSQALITNIAGQANSAFGINALRQTTSDFNTAFGAGALNANTLGSNNTATGYQALNELTGSYSGNTAYGYHAFFHLTSGSNNIAIGSSAGITGGSPTPTALESTNNSIYLGAETKSSEVTGNTNEIVIGYDAKGAGSHSVTLGNSSVLTTILRGAVTATTFNGLTPTALATGFTIAGGTTSKTLTVPLDASVSGTNTGDITEFTDQYTATVGQTTFANLTHTPSAKCVVKIYRNGVRLRNAAVSVSGATPSYVPSGNGGFALVADDIIQIDYFY